MSLPSAWELASELKTLVTTGIRRDRISELPLLMNLQVVVQRAGKDQSKGNRASAAEAVIRDAVATFGDSREAKAYTILLALDAHGGKANRVEKRRADTREALGDHTPAGEWRKGRDAERVFWSN
jgi:hypothetical protein